MPAFYTLLAAYAAFNPGSPEGLRYGLHYLLEPTYALTTLATNSWQASPVRGS